MLFRMPRVRIRHILFSYIMCKYEGSPKLILVNISSVASNTLDISLKPFSVNCLRPLDNIYCTWPRGFNLNVAPQWLIRELHIILLKFLKLVINDHVAIIHSGGCRRAGAQHRRPPPPKKKKKNIYIYTECQKKLITSSEWHSRKSKASTWIIFEHRLGKFVLNKHM